jgi:hypothetical protein
MAGELSCISLSESEFSASAPSPLGTAVRIAGKHKNTTPTRRRSRRAKASDELYVARLTAGSSINPGFDLSSAS